MASQCWAGKGLSGQHMLCIGKAVLCMHVEYIPRSQRHSMRSPGEFWDLAASVRPGRSTFGTLRSSGSVRAQAINVGFPTERAKQSAGVVRADTSTTTESDVNHDSLHPVVVAATGCGGFSLEAIQNRAKITGERTHIRTDLDAQRMEAKTKPTNETSCTSASRCSAAPDRSLKGRRGI